MANHVYRRFKPREDIFSTKVHAHPTTLVESSWSYDGTRHYVRGIQNPYSEFPYLETTRSYAENVLSLYGGVRSRTDVGPDSNSPIKIYPLDLVDTHSIDKVISISGNYPQTGSINLAWVTNTEQPSVNSITDVRWYEEHWSAVNSLFDWYGSHTKKVYSKNLPETFVAIHVPEMFYGRQIATGSVFIWTKAWEDDNGLVNYVSGTGDSNNSGYSNSGTHYYVDDGLGRLLDVPAQYTSSWYNAWMSGSATMVGNVFYNEGLIVFTTGNVFWHQQFWSGSGHDATLGPDLHIQFDGSTIMQSMVFMCRMASGEVNASNNPTYYYTEVAIESGTAEDPNDLKTYHTDTREISPSNAESIVSGTTITSGRFIGGKIKSTGKSWAKSSGSNEGVTYVSAIGIYNEERQLVAVAKLAQPIRKREQDNIDIRLRLDV